MSTKPVAPPPSSSFAASRLNRTTFLIREDDSFGEHPFIYAKLHPRLPILILSDTGCNAPRDPDVAISKLRTFLEEFPVNDNDGSPLNPRNQFGHPERQYTVLVTCCHYSRIGALDQFPTIPLSTSLALERTTRGQALGSKPLSACIIIASGHSETFVTHHLAEHSLCSIHGLKPPSYRVSRWAKDGEALVRDGQKLDVTVLHTPGQTPDKLAWYDHHERSLYVGDSLHERGPHDQPIAFPKEGDWVDYMASLAKLIRFVKRENEYMLADSLNYYNQEYGVCRRVQLCCGYSTVQADGEEMLEQVLALFERILMAKVPVQRSETYRGEIYDTWIDHGGDEVRFAVRAPRRLAEEARKQLGDRALVDSIV